MEHEKYLELLNKLNAFYTDSGPESVSPKSSGRDGESLSDNLLITKDLKFEELDTMTLYLVHTLLHQFYDSGSNKFLTLEDMKDLHDKIKEKITHVDFDQLDR